MEFKQVIRSRVELRAVLGGEPSEKVVRKALDRIDSHCLTYIARSPFLLLATADSEGHVDVSPKGDPPGFVRVLDQRTLAIPDRPGNRRADSMENILQNPLVGVIFLIPGKTETLRISGSARIVADRELLETMTVKGQTPDLCIVVDVAEAFFHCSKCMIRSGLWKEEAWPSLDGLPNLAQTMVDAGNLDLTPEEMHSIVVNDERERLY